MCLVHIRVQWVSHQGAQISAKLQVRELSAWKFAKVRGPLPGQVLSAKHILFQVILMAFREAVFIRAPGKKNRNCIQEIWESCDHDCILIQDSLLTISYCSNCNIYGRTCDIPF